MQFKKPKGRRTKAVTVTIATYSDIQLIKLFESAFDPMIIDEFGFEKLEWKEVPEALSLL